MRHVHRTLAAVMIAAATIFAGAVSANADATGYVSPRFVNQVKPEYPDSARQAGETGEVKIKVLVQADGTAKSFSVFKSSGHKDLDDAVLTAVKASTYRPAYSNGKPTLAFFDITYRFDLKGLAETEGGTGDLESKLAANPNDADTRRVLAIALINKHDYSKAEDVLVKGTQLDPQSAKFWALLGFAYYSDGIQNKKDDLYKSAAEAFDKSLALDSKPDAATTTNAALAYGQYAFVLLENQKFTNALPYARKAAALDPKQTQYQIELGEALQGTNDNAGALAAFKNAQALDDKKSANVTARILADMGITTLALGHEADGVALINQAERVAPASPVAYEALASYYINNGKLDAALGPLNQLTQVSPKDAQVWVTIGDIYVQKKDYANAKTAYAKALAIDPKNGNALFGGAQIAAAQGDLTGAGTGLSAAVAALPSNTALYNATIAAILLGLQVKGGTDPTPDAIKYATTATESDPNLANGWYDLGVGLARLGKKDQANTALHKAFDLFKAQNNATGMAQVNARYKELTGDNISGYTSGHNEMTNQAGH
jgi:TonB family protein